MTAVLDGQLTLDLDGPAAPAQPSLIERARAYSDHHCARVTDAFRARCAAVDAFWADLS